MTLQKNKISKNASIQLRDLIVTNEPIDLKELPPEVDKIHEKVYNKVHKMPGEAIVQLTGYLKKYPDHPVLLNWLICAYQNDGQYDKIGPLVFKNFEKNPTYLFARTNYGMYELRKNSNYKVVPIIFNNVLWLPNLYPERDEFHSTEAESFYQLIGHYYVYDGQLDKAQNVVDLLDSFDANPSIVEPLEMLLNMRMGFENLQKFAKK